MRQHRQRKGEEKKEEEEVEEEAGGKDWQMEPKNGRDIPQIKHQNPGIENIQEDSRPDPNRMIDWHNRTLIRMEAERVGPGEQGKAVQISPDDEKQHSDLFRANGFSGYASDKIAVDRSVPDIRHKGCRKKLYLVRFLCSA